MLVYPPEKIEISDQELDARDRAARWRTRARASAGASSSARAPAVEPEARAVLVGRSPLALPRKAVGEIDRDGKFVVGTLLPGRYEISVRVGSRILQITSGPREVEIPIDPGRHRRSRRDDHRAAPGRRVRPAHLSPLRGGSASGD